MAKGTEWIIVGDFGKLGECLIRPAGTKQDAEKLLDRMLTNPNDNDKRLMKDAQNLRIKEVESAKAWWNDPVLVR